LKSSEVSKHHQSWGRFPKATHVDVEYVRWRHDVPNIEQFEHVVLPFGYGRSYGDSCLNNGGVLLDTTNLNRMISFDAEHGILCCEAGVSFAEILDFIVPRGWFLPATPGTKFVSVGGAIANDVHGKGHHIDGTFGCHVLRFELLRSNGERLICSPTENVELFRATIGGLGLTGLILWAEFKLKPIKSPYIDAERLRHHNLEEFFEISQASQEVEYTVGWIDCLAKGDHIGRGIYTRGTHYDPPLGNGKYPEAKPIFSMPVDLPSFAVNTFTVRAFNEVYYRAMMTDYARSISHYDPFFYPLDTVNNWNRFYGKQGFLQWQCVVPLEAREAVISILERIAHSGQGSPLVVLKTFGDRRSPGMLSFPRRGITLALDFANRGQYTFDLLNELDAIVREVKGAIYPAKDARMSFETFAVSFPNWEEFAQYVDPKFSSSFWRRIMAGRN